MQNDFCRSAHCVKSLYIKINNISDLLELVHISSQKSLYRENQQLCVLISLGQSHHLIDSIAFI